MTNVKSRLARFGRIPKALLRDGAMSANAKTVYGLLDECGSYQSVTIPMLSHWLGQSDRTVQRTLRELSAQGWIEVRPNPISHDRSLPNTYILNDSPFSTAEVVDA